MCTLSLSCLEEKIYRLRHWQHGACRLLQYVNVKEIWEDAIVHDGWEGFVHITYRVKVFMKSRSLDMQNPWYITVTYLTDPL